LLLDEPTNHLDLESIEALANALKRYEGTLLFVSHDRWFVSALADRIIELKDDGLHDFSGTFQEYLDKDGDDHLNMEQVVLQAKKAKKEQIPEPESVPPAAPPPSVLNAKKDQVEFNYEERKRRANRLKSLPKKRDSTMEEIERLESERSQIQARYADPSFFSQASEPEQRKLQYREAQLGAEIDDLMAQWEELEAEIAQLTD
jgi:ABC-type multidrug transport system ATPase subunit